MALLIARAIIPLFLLFVTLPICAGVTQTHVPDTIQTNGPFNISITVSSDANPYRYYGISFDVSQWRQWWSGYPSAMSDGCMPIGVGASPTHQFDIDLTGFKALYPAAQSCTVRVWYIDNYPSSPSTYTFTGCTFTLALNGAAPPPPPPDVVVYVSPTPVSVYVNTIQTFVAQVSGTQNTAVTWSCSGGSITQQGVYTAPATSGQVTVTATSQQDPTKSASAAVTVLDSSNTPPAWWVPSIFSFITGPIGNILSWLQSTLASWLTTILGVINNIYSSLVNGWSALFTLLNNIWGEIIAGVQSILSALSGLGGLLQGIIDFLEDVLAGLFAAIQATVDDILEAMTAFFATAVESLLAIQTDVHGLPDFLTDLLQPLIDGLASILQWFASFFDTLQDMFDASWALLQEALSGLGVLLQSIITGLESLLTFLQGMLQAFWDDYLEAAFGSVVTAITALQSAISTLFDSLHQWFLDLASSLSSSIGQSLLTVNESVGGLAGWLASIVGWLSSLLDSVTGGFQALLDLMTSFFDYVFEFLERVAGLLDGLPDLLASIPDYLTELFRVLFVPTQDYQSELTAAFAPFRDWAPISLFDPLLELKDRSGGTIPNIQGETPYGVVTINLSSWLSNDLVSKVRFFLALLVYFSGLLWLMKAFLPRFVT